MFETDTFSFGGVNFLRAIDNTPICHDYIRSMQRGLAQSDTKDFDAAISAVLTSGEWLIEIYSQVCRIIYAIIETGDVKLWEKLNEKFDDKEVDFQHFDLWRANTHEKSILVSKMADKILSGESTEVICRIIQDKPQFVFTSDIPTWEAKRIGTPADYNAYYLMYAAVKKGNEKIFNAITNYVTSMNVSEFVVMAIDMENYQLLDEITKNGEIFQFNRESGITMGFVMGKHDCIHYYEVIAKRYFPSVVENAVRMIFGILACNERHRYLDEWDEDKANEDELDADELLQRFFERNIGELLETGLSKDGFDDPVFTKSLLKIAEFKPAICNPAWIVELLYTYYNDNTRDITEEIKKYILPLLSAEAEINLSYLESWHKDKGFCEMFRRAAGKRFNMNIDLFYTGINNLKRLSKYFKPVSDRKFIKDGNMEGFAAVMHLIEKDSSAVMKFLFDEGILFEQDMDILLEHCIKRNLLKNVLFINEWYEKKAGD